MRARYIGFILAGFALGVLISGMTVEADRLPCLSGRACLGIHNLPFAHPLGVPLGLWGSALVVLASALSCVDIGRRAVGPLMVIGGITSLGLQIYAKSAYRLYCTDCLFAAVCLLAGGLLLRNQNRSAPQDSLVEGGALSGGAAIACLAIWLLPNPRTLNTLPRETVAKLLLPSSTVGIHYVIFGSPDCPACLRQQAEWEDKGVPAGVALRFFDVHGSAQALELEARLRSLRRHHRVNKLVVSAETPLVERLKLARTLTSSYEAEFSSDLADCRTDRAAALSLGVNRTPSVFRINADGSANLTLEQP